MPQRRPSRHQPSGRLAEIIVLDQYARNVYRNTPRAFAQDALAHAQAVALFSQPRLERALWGRRFTLEKRDFLSEPGSSFEVFALHLLRFR